MDLLENNSQLISLSLSSNSLAHQFCEKLSEFLKLNEYIRSVDISCNFIDDGNVGVLKDAIESNPNIIELDVRSNELTPEVEAEIKEIITKNFLNSKDIPYKKLSECKIG